MEKLTKVLDTYSRYLNSLINKETDVSKNYYAMKTVIEKDCEPWLKKHMLQDSFINALRSNRGQYDQVEPSSRIQLLMEAITKDEDGEELYKTAIPRVELSLKADGAEGFSWLPTLYKYFNPKDIFELHSMEEELRQMHKIGLVSDTHSQSVLKNTFSPRKQQFKMTVQENKREEELQEAMA